MIYDLNFALYILSECAELIVCWKIWIPFNSNKLSLLSLNDENKADGRSESDAMLSVCMLVHSFWGNASESVNKLFSLHTLLLVNMLLTLHEQ